MKNVAKTPHFSAEMSAFFHSKNCCIYPTKTLHFSAGIKPSSSFCYFRSWDLIGGFPTNLGGIQLLKEHMAKEITNKINKADAEVKDGELIADSKGLHIYDHQWDYAKVRCYKTDKALAEPSQVESGE